ncbi:bacillithiol biosynthesis deacetylase BshB1 [Flavobacteriaceae bacterium]|jgi:N-acetylglucosamine malate deacetylase 1|nr:GlcNAc-PI de-N-acetylase, carbohydrate esterase family CE14 [uncultured bacterium]MDA9139424.1 bacillithiol biosynthesis deacetylase BshB1 [Flavobacteriaceae bacterium]MDA9250920.1 bacillithiol biosynthesis deacetylase BshB1 [Flavobacteriaceae bacterium]
MKLDILAFGAHPDDVELGCGATIAKAVAQGKKVGIIDLTKGEMGTRGTDLIRSQEAEQAARILGVDFRENLGFRDAFIFNDESHQLKVIQAIRSYQPDIVLCNAIKDRHIDHARSSELISNACFLSGLNKIKTNNNNITQKAWRPKQVFHYIQWEEIQPDFVVDVSDYLTIKMKAVKAFKSQFYDEDSNDVKTPISSKNFLDSIEYRAKNLGRLSFIAAAEGFTVERSITVENFDVLL